MKRFMLACLIIISPAFLTGCDEAIFYSLFPPKDYYDPVLSMNIDPDVSLYSSDVIHVYKGSYSISLILQQAPGVEAGYSFTELDVNCAIEHQRSRIEIPCGVELLPFWGEDSGISVGTYAVPVLIPQKEKVRFYVEFTQAGQLQMLETQHGPIELRIDKWSDL
jgi:hypothetical protein